MATGAQHFYYLSGGASNTDPNAALGGARSTVVPAGQLHYHQGTLTATQTSRQRFLGSTGVSGVVAGDLVLFATGGNALQVAEVASYNSGTGEFVLLEGTVGLATLGDTYRLHHENNLFDDVSAAQCAAGHVDHRCLYVRNESGAVITTGRLYFSGLDGGGAGVELAADDTVDSVIPSIGTETTAPDLSTFATGGGIFHRPTTYADSMQPLPQGANMSNNQHRGFWIRRTVSAGQAKRRKAVVLAVHLGVEGSAGAGAAVLSWTMDGFTLALEVIRDRFQHVRGGGRFTAVATAQETGLPVADQPIGWTLTGPGSIFPGADERTDEEGLNTIPYHASILQGDAGAAVTVTAKGI
jgi:hypothetical protein